MQEGAAPGLLSYLRQGWGDFRNDWRALCGVVVGGYLTGFVINRAVRWWVQPASLVDLPLALVVDMPVDIYFLLVLIFRMEAVVVRGRREWAFGRALRRWPLMLGLFVVVLLVFGVIIGVTGAFIRLVFALGAGGLLSGILAVVLALIGSVLALWLWVRFAFLGYSLPLWRLGIWGYLRESARLSRGLEGKILGVTAILLVALLVLGLLPASFGARRYYLFVPFFVAARLVSVPILLTAFRLFLVAGSLREGGKASA
ncbi:MAG: hypothetical protein ACE5JJ_10985 [Nitrospinota bacterium]